MTCPDGKYALMLKTPSGLTPEEPFTLVPNVFAMSDWFAQTDRIITRAEAAFREYTNYKPAEDWTTEETARWTDLDAEWKAIKERRDNIESPWNLLDWTHADAGTYITDLVGLAVDTACEWQKFDEALAALGGKPTGAPDPSVFPPPPMGVLEKALWTAGLIGGGALLFYGVRTFQNRKGAT